MGTMIRMIQMSMAVIALPLAYPASGNFQRKRPDWKAFGAL
jgi:hypothetical protein